MANQVDPKELASPIIRLLATNARGLLKAGSGALVMHGWLTGAQQQVFDEKAWGIVVAVLTFAWGNVTQLWQAKMLLAAHALPEGASPADIRKRAGELAIADMFARARRLLPSREQIDALEVSTLENSRQIELLHKSLAELRRAAPLEAR